MTAEGQRRRRERVRAPSGVPDAVGAVGPPAAVLLAVLAGWQAAVVITGAPSVVLPSPADVAAATAAALPTLLADAAVTAVTAGAGLVGGSVVGLALAFAMLRSSTAAAVVHPAVVALRVAPLVAIAPLVVLWVGSGLAARVLLVTTLTVFPVTVASYDGLRSVPREYIDLLRTVDAAPRRQFLFVRLPAAAPSVFAGLKLAAALSVVGAVVAEFVTLDAGIGYRVFHTALALETPTTFAALLVLSLLGVAFYLVPAAVEARIRWWDR